MTFAIATLLFLLSLAPGPAVAGKTYYVDGANGLDARTATEAQNPATPWRTIKRAIDAGGLIDITKKGVPLAGYTVVVAAGLYSESVESKRDGLATDPIVIRAATRGTVVIQPPPGTNGFFISHHYHVVDGFVVTGGVNGLKMGPHDGGDGPVFGLVARYNEARGNSSNGIQFANGQSGEAAFNTVYQNGLNGIVYSGNGSAIHDNLAYSNGQFGIYVRDGMDHQVWNNTAYGNGVADIKLVGSQVAPPGGRTFYVGPNGSDSYTDVQAQNPQTPWKTVLKGLQGTNPGDTLAILPGLYAANVQSVRDGASGAPITIRAVEPGTVIISPASGVGVYIGHHYHVVEGLIVTGATTGLQMGPYKQTGGTVNGLVARDNQVTGNGLGIKFTNVIDASVMHNVVWNNAKDGILYSWVNQTNCPPGTGATIFNNLVYANGGNLSGEYGITVGCGDSNKVVNNTVYGNINGGIRLGVAGDVPVLSTVVNNIVVRNGVGVSSGAGIREPAGDNYTGRALLDFNNVYNNGTGSNRDYWLSGGSGTVVGPNSISVSPRFVDPDNGDFRLGRVATGQPADSSVIDRGSDTASAVGLAGRTAFIDKYPDVGRVDLGYHGTLLYPSQGTAAIDHAALTFHQGVAGFTLSGNLKPGAGSDGLNPGGDYAEVTFGEIDLPLWIAGFQQQGSRWVFTGDGGSVTAALEKLGDGSVNFSVQASGLSLSTVKFPTSATLRIGDDFGSATVPLTGALQFP